MEQISSIPEKKKRGRKPIIKQETEEKVYKKRGRRPKLKSEGENENENENDKKYSLFKNMNNELNFILESCIIHLKINNKDLYKLDSEHHQYKEEDNSESNYFNLTQSDKNTEESVNTKDDSLYSIKTPIFNIRNIDIKFIENIESVIETSQEKNIIDMKLSQNSRKVKNIMDFFKNNWLEKSPYACWNCTENFNNFPIGIPLNINDEQKFNLYGNFCSFSCASRYLIETENGEIANDRMQLLNLLSQTLTQDSNYKINIASSRLVLKKFGGIQSIDEYRANSITDNKKIKVYKPPLVPVLYLMEEYANQVKKDYKKTTGPVHLDKNTFMNSYDKSRKNNDNVKDSIMRSFVGKLN